MGGAQGDTTEPQGFAVEALIVLTPTGQLVPGTKAIFWAPFKYGPTMPGPLIKKPNTSKKLVQVNPGYSSEPNT